MGADEVEKKNLDFAVLGDAPVLEAARQDLLKYTATAKVLAGAAVETREPLTIGIFGEWGMGKTSLMRLVRQEVDKHANVVSAWFNAWQYEKEEHLIVPLVATINRELKLKENTWPDTLKEGASTVWKALRSIAYGFSVSGKVGIPLISEAEVNLSPKDMFDQYQNLMKDTLLSRSLYFDAFQELEKCAKAGKSPRIVVFVDDLDRCFPDKAVALLEGIKLVLHQPGFSFVLGVNEAIIQSFIRTKYEKDFQIVGSHFDDYLDKIVQVKIPVPRRETDDMRKYIEELIKERQVFPESSREDAIALIADACKHNPRSVVRLLNRILVTSRIFQSEGTECEPLSLLLHIAMDEHRYAAFREALDVTVVGALKEDADRPLSIGECLSDALKTYGAKHSELIAQLHETQLKSRKDKLEEVTDVLARNQHLCNLFKTDIGQRWLKDKAFRENLGKATEVASGETKREESVRKTVSVEVDGPILELLRNMVSIPAGEFMMGSEENDSEEPVHRVKLEAFEIGAMQVTQAQYEAVMKTNPYSFKGADLPVESVSWNDAKVFCEQLTRLVNDGRRFTLPSEAQWEYACRAGSTTKYCFGDSEEELGKYAWYDANSESKTHPVGMKKPNKWGLYDMHGNVLEWVEDDWHGSYENPPTDGRPWIDDPRGDLRVLRGGGWCGDFSLSCRSAYRSGSSPGFASISFGFRLARTL